MVAEVAPVRVWRVMLTGRVLGVVFASAFSALVLLPADESAGALGYAEVALMWLAVWAFGFRPRVELRTDGVSVQGPLRSWEISSTQIREAIPGPDGIEFNLHDGSTVTAWAVQKWPITYWLGRESRADRACARIRETIGSD